MPWGAVAGAVIGGGLGLMGSRESARAQRDAARAAQPRPFNLESPFGNANYTPSGMQAVGGIGSENALPFSQLVAQNLAAYGGSPIHRLGNAPFDLRQVLGPIDDLGRNPMSMGADLLGADFMRRSSAALGANNLFNPDAFAADQFARLNRLAAPGEQTAASTLADRLFSRGRLGANDTAAGRLFGELDLSQSLARDARLGQALGLAGTERDRLAGYAGQFADAFGSLGALGQNLRAGNQGQILGLFGALRGDELTTANFGNQLREALLSQATGAQGGVQNAFLPLQDAMRLSLQGAGLGPAAGAQAAQYISQAGRDTGNFYAGLGANFLNAGINYAQRPRSAPVSPSGGGGPSINFGNAFDEYRGANFWE